MKLYRVSKKQEDGEHRGYSWHGSLHEAGRAAKDFEHDFHGINTVVEPVVFEPTKKGILDLLNGYASHEDNG